MINFKQLFKIKDTSEAQAHGVGLSFFWGTAISNPLITIPLYSLYSIGHLIISGSNLRSVISKLSSFSKVINLGADFFITVFFGTTLIGILEG